VNVQGFALPLTQSTGLVTIGARVTVVVNEKDMGNTVLLAEQATPLVPHRTCRLEMGKLGSALVRALDAQLAMFAISDGGEYWMDCPKARSAPQAERNWKPATAASARGRNKLNIRKAQRRSVSAAKVISRSWT
jgi:hypothetical protein